MDRRDAAHGHRSAARRGPAERPLRAALHRRRPSCRAYFQRADLVVLPYREIDQSGVLFTALAFGKPLLLSDVGGFPEVAATGAARTFPAGDVPALHAALRGLLADPAALATMAGRARAAAAGPYSWEAIARARWSCTSSLASARRQNTSRSRP